MKKLVLILAFCLPFLAQANSGKIDFVEYKLDKDRKSTRLNSSH